MRALVVSNLYPPHYLGGYELSCRDVMERWAARGHDVRVLTTDVRLPGVDDPPAEPAVGVFRDLEFYWDDHELVSPPLRSRMRMERANQAALARHLREHAPDVVSVWNMGAMSLGLLAALLRHGTPMVLNVCDEWPVYGPRLDAWSRPLIGHPLLATLVGRLSGLPTAPRRLAGDVTACFVSDFIRERVAAEGRVAFEGLAASTVVYSGIDERDFPVEARPPAPWSGRLLYTGRLDPRKGVFTALTALRQLPPDHRLDLVGRGGADVEQQLQAEIDRHELHSRVTMSVADRSELAATYRRADAFLFTSEWAEPFGLTPVEAMACGTPVVATATGGSAEFLIDGGNCLRYPPGDADALAAAVRRLAAEPDLRQRLVEGGLTTARQLGVDALADHLEVWHRAAADRYAHGLPPHRHLHGGAGEAPHRVEA